MSGFRVWAPAARTVELVLSDARVPLGRADGGWWSVDVPAAGPGTDYRFAVDGGEPRPDPRSPHQPEGVHGPSRVVDFDAFGWTDDAWKGLHLPSAVIYELHVGTFTSEGTFDAAISRLDALVDLGVSCVELMPVAEFPGDRGWGYDGVDLYAPHHAYGGPEGLARFVDACHARGLGVLLDVVYNHLGPDGNYLGVYGPYFTDRYRTPWGDAVNLDGPGSDEVRRFFVDNARHWLEHYHLDGLRVDAVHAFYDRSAVHFLEELGAEVHALSAHLGRPLSVIAESDLNDPRLVRAREAGGYGLDAMWSDDFHHALHTVFTGEGTGYYEDFGRLGQLAKALERGLAYDGGHSVHRGRRHGRPYGDLPGYRLVGYLQNHDQVGNRARGDRIGHLVSLAEAQIGAALVLTSPFVPMLFQGEEWAATSPFPYFTDHLDRALGDAVREGRRREFAAFGWDPEEVPDPQAEATFASARLDWSERERSPHREMLRFTKRLLALRRETPALTRGDLGAVRTRHDESEGWLTVAREGVLVVCVFAEGARTVPLGERAWEVRLASDPRVAEGDRLEREVRCEGPAVLVLRARH